MPEFSYPTVVAEMPITQTYYMASSLEGGNPTVVSSAPCTVYSLDCYSTGPSGLRIGLFDKASAPTGADTPRWVVYLPGQDGTEKTWTQGLRFSAGLAFSIMAEVDGSLVAGSIQSLNIGYRTP